MSKKKKARRYQRRIGRILKRLWVHPAHLQEVQEVFPELKDQFEYLEDMLATARYQAVEERPDATIH